MVLPGSEAKSLSPSVPEPRSPKDGPDGAVKVTAAAGVAERATLNAPASARIAIDARKLFIKISPRTGPADFDENITAK